MKCLIYVIFILVLQQIDGNIIGPKILGSSTGINGFWIMFAILLGGGLFSSYRSLCLCDRLVLITFRHSNPAQQLVILLQRKNRMGALAVVPAAREHFIAHDTLFRKLSHHIPPYRPRI